MVFSPPAGIRATRRPNRKPPALATHLSDSPGVYFLALLRHSRIVKTIGLRSVSWRSGLLGPEGLRFAQSSELKCQTRFNPAGSSVVFGFAVVPRFLCMLGGFLGS